jgi:hypothetical protein
MEMGIAARSAPPTLKMGDKTVMEGGLGGTIERKTGERSSAARYDGPMGMRGVRASGLA